jgi:hypothetical protein
MRAVEEAPRGVLHLRSGRGRFEVARARPSPALADLVEHFWLVSWDLRGRDPHLQHTLPHPGVHLVAEPEHSGIQGVLTGRFSRRLEGAGRAFGVRFRPAGFQPFLGAPVAVLTDRRVPVAEVFGPDGDRLVARLLAAGDQTGRVAAAEAFLLARRPAPDPAVALVNRVVDRIMTDREITRVGDVADRAGVGTRRLQRLFATYVGSAPSGSSAGPASTRRSSAWTRGTTSTWASWPASSATSTRPTSPATSATPSAAHPPPTPRPRAAVAQRSERASSSSRSICSCMPPSIPDSRMASRTCRLGVRASSERVVRPSTSEKVTSLTAGSGSGAPGISKTSVCTIRSPGTISWYSPEKATSNPPLATIT